MNTPPFPGYCPPASFPAYIVRWEDPDSHVLQERTFTQEWGQNAANAFLLALLMKGKAKELTVREDSGKMLLQIRETCS